MARKKSQSYIIYAGGNKIPLVLWFLGLRLRTPDSGAVARSEIGTRRSRQPIVQSELARENGYRTRHIRRSTINYIPERSISAKPDMSNRDQSRPAKYSEPLGRGAGSRSTPEPDTFNGRAFTSTLLVPIRRIEAVKLSQQGRPRQFTVPIGLIGSRLHLVEGLFQNVLGWIDQLGIAG